MSHANQHGKPLRNKNMIKRQRAIMKYIQRAVGLAGQQVASTEAEAAGLVQRSNELKQAMERGESPDPHEVAQLQAAEADFLLRQERFTAYMAALAQQAEAVSHVADEVLFEEYVRQFKAQFNIKEDL